MLIRIGETRWANLYNLLDISITHVKRRGSDEVKFRASIRCAHETYDTDLVDTKEEAIAQAEEIVRQFNAE